MGMEILKRLEPWKYEKCIPFRFKSESTLYKFADFVTDVNNAEIVFSTGLYRINDLRVNGEIPKDPEILRKKGARFTCHGLYLPLEKDISVEFIVSSYVENRIIEIETAHLSLVGFLARIDLQWRFDNDQKKAAFRFHINSPIPRFAIGLVFPQDNQIDEEMDSVTKRIVGGFCKKNNSQSSPPS